MNIVTIIGNLTKKPELIPLENGNQVAKTSVAINERWKKEDGQIEERTVFIDVDIWGKQAINAEKFLDKGSKVAINGKLGMNTWEDSETKKNRTKIFITANIVEYLNTNQENNDKDDKEALDKKSIQKEVKEDNPKSIIEDDTKQYEEDFEEEIPF